MRQGIPKVFETSIMDVKIKNEAYKLEQKNPYCPN